MVKSEVKSGLSPVRIAQMSLIALAAAAALAPIKAHAQASAVNGISAIKLVPAAPTAAEIAAAAPAGGGANTKSGFLAKNAGMDITVIRYATRISLTGSGPSFNCAWNDFFVQQVTDQNTGGVVQIFYIKQPLQYPFSGSTSYGNEGSNSLATGIAYSSGMYITNTSSAPAAAPAGTGCTGTTFASSPSGNPYEKTRIRIDAAGTQLCVTGEGKFAQSSQNFKTSEVCIGATDAKKVSLKDSTSRQDVRYVSFVAELLPDSVQFFYRHNWGLNYTEGLSSGPSANSAPWVWSSPENVPDDAFTKNVLFQDLITAVQGGATNLAVARR